MKKNILIIFYISLISLIGISYSIKVIAMSSSNYKLEKDSINIGGLDTSESTSYKIFDTVGETATGDSASSNYNMLAGYRQLDEVYIAIAGPSSIAMTPSIGGLSGGVANGSGTWNVKSDSAAGYYLSIKASSSPAMKSGTNNFPDYTPSILDTPDYDWDISSANSEFGFSPFNANSQITKFKNNGSACDTGTNINDGKCWDGLSTNYEQIANKLTRTSIEGEDTKVNFKAEVAGLQVAGSYEATIVVTAVSN